MADLRSRLDLPPVDKSAMDGYAVLAGDDRAEYRLVETMPAGAIVEFLPIRGARS
jgi:molybdopterin biosynthesis enzyme